MIRYVVNLCKYYGVQTKAGRLNDFNMSCKNGDLSGLKRINFSKLSEEQINNGLIISIENNQEFVIPFLIENGASDINSCLEKATKANRFNLIKVLVEKGGDTRIVLRYSKSQNIINFIYKYENEKREKREKRENKEKNL